jgi:tetratricopeptide (TPR) repeat protein
VFLSYPGLHSDSSANRVEVANTAYEMGSYFFRTGDFQLATPFFTIASSGGTGAASALGATMRLKLLGGDVEGALMSSFERAQRYHDSRAYRDYLGLLHATGHSKEAWAAFNTLVRELQAPHIWETALVGHHVAGLTEAQVTEWAKRDEFRNAGNRVSYAINYLARFATTDRVPSEQLASMIADLDRPTWQFDTGHKSVVRAQADGANMWVLGPADAITGSAVLPMGLFDGGGPKHRVRPALSYFVEGYRDLKLKHYPEAKRVFDEAATLYDMTNPQSSYMLPYYALASAKAGTDVSTVEQILARLNPKEQLLDYQLARAALEAVGKPSDALASLKLARYRRPNNEENVLLTQFTYADICESLYQITGNAEIRRVALDWVKNREKAEPWQSWSYALEATLTSDPSDRQRAIAMTHYLDPQSAHLASFSKLEIEEAVRRFGSVNIFLHKQPGAVRGTTT